MTYKDAYAIVSDSLDRDGDNGEMVFFSRECRLAIKDAMEDKMEQSYWGKICDMQRAQMEKGIRTYGQTLEENKKLSIEERLTYLEEELIDGLMYVEHIKAGLKDSCSVTKCRECSFWDPYCPNLPDGVRYCSTTARLTYGDDFCSSAKRRK